MVSIRLLDVRACACLRVAVGLGVISLLTLGAVAGSLDETFLRPPQDAKPQTWYHLMNGNVTKAGVTADFEAIAKAGLGGVQMFDAGCDIPAGPLKFNSPEWFDLLRHAASEARRLNLEICIPNCSGWSSSGGPWNVPSNGMKVVTWREVAVKGPRNVQMKLPRERNDNGWYEDIAVLAFPTPKADLETFTNVTTTIGGSNVLFAATAPFTTRGFMLELHYGWIFSSMAQLQVDVSTDGTNFIPLATLPWRLAYQGHGDRGPRFHVFEKPVTARALRLTVLKNALPVTIAGARLSDGMTLENLKSKTFVLPYEITRDDSVASDAQVVPTSAVRDLSKLMSADGTLVWEVPAGDWTIVRYGAVCNGRRNHPASKHGVGLEVDKLSASALDAHFEAYVEKVCRALGPLAGDVRSGLNNILVDSFEVGSQNWTQHLDEIFAKRKGYSLIPYLPVFSNHIVGSVDESERFLEDFRRVVCDLFAENYAGELAKKCHAAGLRLSLEAYGGCPADNLQYGAPADIPMGEFWSSTAHLGTFVEEGNARFPGYLAHVWGRKYVGTESFTANPANGGRWSTTPFALKAQCDRVYTRGVNRIIYHRFTHQPWTDPAYVPGMTMGRWGMHFDRTQTWWPYVQPWIRYQTRCQAMLQRGSFVADALFYDGERAPNQGGYLHDSKILADLLPPGYAWDVCAKDALLNLRVENGNLVSPGGTRYRLLVLTPHDTMSKEVAAKLTSLFADGAKICFEALPSRAPGLVGYPTADAEVRAAVAKLVQGGAFVGSPAEVLSKMNVDPDFEVKGVPADGPTGATYIHRREDGADWYFVALPNPTAVSFEASFRTRGCVPEIWNPETGTIADAATWRIEGDRTVVTLDFVQSGSAFVVFRRPLAAGQTGATGKPSHELAHQDVAGTWQVRFPEKFLPNALAKGGDEILAFPRLLDWSLHPLDGIRYFSGTATYLQTVTLSPGMRTALKQGRRVVLDLGVVHEVAQVTVNGFAYPALWKPPFRQDVTQAVGSATTLKIEVRVANLWANRLIGDDRTHAPDCEWKGGKVGGVKEIGIKEIPAWVKAGKKSPTGRVTFETWQHWDKDDQLLPSGLIGPVRLTIW